MMIVVEPVLKVSTVVVKIRRASLRQICQQEAHQGARGEPQPALAMICRIQSGQHPTGAADRLGQLKPK